MVECTAYWKTHDTSVPSFLNAPIFGLNFANRCKNFNDVGFRADQTELTFSISLSSINGRRSTSSRLQNMKIKIISITCKFNDDCTHSAVSLSASSLDMQ